MPTSFKFELIIFEYHCVFGWNSTVLNILNIHLAHLNLYLIHHPSLFLCFFIFLFFIVSHLLFVFFDCLLILLKLFIYSMKGIFAQTSITKVAVKFERFRTIVLFC